MSATEAQSGTQRVRARIRTKGMARLGRLRQLTCLFLRKKPKLCYDFYYFDKCEQDNWLQGFNHFCPLKLPDGTVC